MVVWKLRGKKTNKTKDNQRKKSRGYDSPNHKKWEKKVDKGELESASISTEKFFQQLELGVYNKLVIKKESGEGKWRKQVLT